MSFPAAFPLSHPGRASIWLGVEQEFDLFEDSRRLDFRALLPRILSRGRWLPFRNCESAAVLEAGYVLGSDGMEAEFATAPISMHADGPLALAREAARCRNHMRQLLTGAGVEDVRGYSTHLSISVPAGREVEAAHELSATVAPALILLMEARASPGLLLRTRRGRLEVGSEYIDDERQLGAAATFLAGVIHAFLFNRPRWNEFPRVRRQKWEEANIRPGIFLPRDAFGPSIHDLGRGAVLELEAGGKLTAGELLKRCTLLVSLELDGHVDSRAMSALQRVAFESGTLQIDRDTDPAHLGQHHGGDPAPESATLTMLVRARHTRLIPRFVDWEGAAFVWPRLGRKRILGVPWGQLPVVLRGMSPRALMPRHQKTQAVLNSLEQLASPQTFRALDAVALGTQALGDKGAPGGKGTPGGKGGTSKPPEQITGPARYTPRHPFPWIPAVLIGILLIGGGTIILTRRPPQPQLSPTAPPFQEVSPTATPTQACLPPAVLAFPPNGSSLPIDIYVLKWRPMAPLPPGASYVVLAASDPALLATPGSAPTEGIGTSVEPSLTIDFNSWKHRGQEGDFFWTVRIVGAAGEFLDCPNGDPGTFTLKPPDTTRKKPEQEGGGCVVNCP